MITQGDQWAVTTDDATSNQQAFMTAPGDLSAKLAAAIVNDRLRLKTRIGAVEPTTPTEPGPASEAVSDRIMVDRVNDDLSVSKHILSLAAYDSVDFTAGGVVVFGNAGFTIIKAKLTPALAEHLKKYYGYADVSK